MKKSPLLPRLKLSALLRSADGFAARTRTLKKLVLPNSSVLKVSQILETPTQVSLLVLLRSPSIGQPSSPNAHIKKTTVPLLVRRPTEPPPSPSLKRDISNLLRSSLTLLSLWRFCLLLIRELPQVLSKEKVMSAPGLLKVNATLQLSLSQRTLLPLPHLQTTSGLFKSLSGVPSSPMPLTTLPGPPMLVHPENYITQRRKTWALSSLISLPRTSKRPLQTTFSVKLNSRPQPRTVRPTYPFQVTPSKTGLLMSRPSMILMMLRSRNTTKRTRLGRLMLSTPPQLQVSSTGSSDQPSIQTSQRLFPLLSSQLNQLTFQTLSRTSPSVLPLPQPPQLNTPPKLDGDTQ